MVKATRKSAINNDVKLFECIEAIRNQQFINVIFIIRVYNLSRITVARKMYKEIIKSMTHESF